MPQPPHPKQRAARHAALLALVVSLGLATAAGAQTPVTDVWLADLAAGEATEVGTPRNVTERAGYDNQPAFSPDGKLLYYTSIEGEQADIMRYDLATGERSRAIATAESEYSPTPVFDGRALSVVRVEADGTQRLWRFTLDGIGPPVLLLPDVMPVGYHAWIDEARLVLFVLGEPPTLEYAELGEKATTRLASNIGRALARIPDAASGPARMSFIHKKADDDWWVMAWDAASGALEPLVATRPGSEDVAWAPDGSLWTGDGSVLWRWRPGRDDGFQRVADLSAAGVTGITRLAFRPDGKMLALVAERPAS